MFLFTINHPPSHCHFSSSPKCLGRASCHGQTYFGRDQILFLIDKLGTSYTYFLYGYQTCHPEIGWHIMGYQLQMVNLRCCLFLFVYPTQVGEYRRPITILIYTWIIICSKGFFLYPETQCLYGWEIFIHISKSIFCLAGQALLLWNYKSIKGKQHFFPDILLT